MNREDYITHANSAQPEAPVDDDWRTNPNLPLPVGQKILPPDAMRKRIESRTEYNRKQFDLMKPVYEAREFIDMVASLLMAPDNISVEQAEAAAKEYLSMPRTRIKPNQMIPLSDADITALKAKM